LVVVDDTNAMNDRKDIATNRSKMFLNRLRVWTGAEENEELPPLVKS